MSQNLKKFSYTYGLSRIFHGSYSGDIVFLVYGLFILRQYFDYMTITVTVRSKA
jgi:hypothetical protein